MNLHTLSTLYMHLVCAMDNAGIKGKACSIGTNARLVVCMHVHILPPSVSSLLSLFSTPLPLLFLLADLSSDGLGEGEDFGQKFLRLGVE